jgi:hypothetical protein
LVVRTGHEPRLLRYGGVGAFTLPSTRNEAERYRIYELHDGSPVCIATTPDQGGVAAALFTLAADRRDAGLNPQAFGVLDGITGRWLSSLWPDPEPTTQGGKIDATE